MIKVQKVIGVLMIGLMLGLVGCASESAARFELSVVADDTMRQAGLLPSFEVDIVGVEPLAHDLWFNAPLNKYFSGGIPLRSTALRYTVKFSNDDVKPKILSKDDPIWQKWFEKGAKELYILAYLPGLHDDKAGMRDSRRLILPLDITRWETGKIEIKIFKGSVSSTTPPLPAPPTE
jgi:hypothetical protein